MKTMQTRWLLSLSFFLFISYIIFLADTADYNFAFRIVGHVPYGDKIAHAVLYGMMALLLNYALGFRSYKVSERGFPNLQLGAIIVLIFATLEEFSQHYIPSRTFDLWDLGADFVGVVLFSIVRMKK